MRCTTLTALLLGVMLYLVMGALVFLTLETEQKYQGLNGHCEHILTKLSCVQGVFSAVEAGLDVSSLSANLTTRWDMASAIFFCGTIITTIGFGNLSPHTTYGQLFCVCYALVGIPMFGILLAGVGDHMGTVLRRAVAKIETLFLKRKVRPTTVRVISAVLSILIGCLIFLAVPTVVFQEVEEWTFLESLYFVVITLTTVGFGDFVPGGGTKDGKIFKPLVLLWIVFGLAYFASILTMIGNWLRVLSKRTRAEVRLTELDAEHGLPYPQSAGIQRPVPPAAPTLEAFPPYSAPHLPSILSVLPPSPDTVGAPPPSCQLLDFFGENLAYIDESSDTLSERGQVSEERRRRPRKRKQGFKQLMICI
uniref:Potassium channel, subfamily K, member 4a n=1 Tax=Salarias fasciatus TaxID=181472 RepID=A0A672GJT2_SALFA